MTVIIDGTNGISDVDGSAGTPALRGTDANTGVLFPAADTVAIGTGGTERLRVDSSGNVGIGTTSPGANLDIVSAGNSVFRIGTTDANKKATFTYDNSGNTFTIGVENGYGITPIIFRNNGAERMRIDSSGNVGIGTSSPAGKLDVNGPIFGSAVQIRAAGGEGGELNLLNPDNGSVGLIVDVATADNGRIFSVRNNSALTLGQLVGTGGIINFATAGIERMRIDANGNVIAGASAALATNATNGFLYVPTCAGTPTGTPTTITGMAPIVVNTTNNKLYFYSGGAWRDAGP